jgi:hypothetical protein
MRTGYSSRAIRLSILRSSKLRADLFHALGKKAECYNDVRQAKLFWSGDVKVQRDSWTVS